MLRHLSIDIEIKGAAWISENARIVQSMHKSEDLKCYCCLSDG